MRYLSHKRVSILFVSRWNTWPQLVEMFWLPFRYFVLTLCLYSRLLKQANISGWRVLLPHHNIPWHCHQPWGYNDYKIFLSTSMLRWNMFWCFIWPTGHGPIVSSLLLVSHWCTRTSQGLLLCMYVYCNTIHCRNQVRSGLMIKSGTKNWLLIQLFIRCLMLLAIPVWLNLLNKFIQLLNTLSKLPTLFMRDHNNMFGVLAYVNLLESGWELAPTSFLGLQ